jgi:hypothetical protein
VSGESEDGNWCQYTRVGDGQWELELDECSEESSDDDIEYDSVSRDGLSYISRNYQIKFNEPMLRYHLIDWRDDDWMLFVCERDLHPVVYHIWVRDSPIGYNIGWNGGEIIDIYYDYVLVLNNSGEYDVYHFAGGKLGLVASNVYYVPVFMNQP